MADFEGETWVEIYQKALVELEHATMRGRIGDARTAILARVEKLKDIPGLHAGEHRAIDDALNALRFLEREEERYDENQRRAETGIHRTEDQEAGVGRTVQPIFAFSAQW